MNDFRAPYRDFDTGHVAQEHVNTRKSQFNRDWLLGVVGGFFRREWNLDRTAPNSDRSGVPANSTNAASFVANDSNLQNRRAPRLWNPALGCAPNPFGAASNGVHYFDNTGMLVYLPSQPDGQNAVLMKLNVVRQAPLRALAGTANARPAAGGSGSAENVRLPSVSTIGAF